MSTLNDAIKAGVRTVGELAKELKFQEVFNAHKEYIALNHGVWEDVSIEDAKTLFMLEMYEQGAMPSSLEVSDYLENDYGVTYIENNFSNDEIKKIELIELLNEEKFLIKRDSLVRELIRKGEVK